jgi:dCMP deaminase
MNWIAGPEEGVSMNNWDRKFLDAAILTASWSKDPSTKVGCVITDGDHNQLAGGFNGFPRDVADDHRLTDRETKLKLIVHAEANAVAAAARNGHALKGSTAYITLPPCAQCAALLIQAGVRAVVFLSGAKPSKWEADWVTAQGLLAEAGIQFEEVERAQP